MIKQSLNPKTYRMKLNEQKKIIQKIGQNIFMHLDELYHNQIITSCIDLHHIWTGNWSILVTSSKNILNNGDRLFEENVYLLLSSIEINKWDYALLIGKLLLWSWMHNGAWPRWFHKCQLKYIIDGKNSFSCEPILSECNKPPIQFGLCEITQNVFRIQRIGTNKYCAKGSI